MFFIYIWLLTICDVDKNLQKKRWRQHKKVVPVRPYICGKIQDYANKNYKNHSCIHRCETASGRNERKRVGQWVHWDNAVLLWAERGGSPNVNQREVQDTGTSGNLTDHQNHPCHRERQDRQAASGAGSAQWWIAGPGRQTGHPTESGSGTLEASRCSWRGGQTETRTGCQAAGKRFRPEELQEGGKRNRLFCRTGLSGNVVI